MKLNHTLKREQIAKDLVAFYEASGVEFICAAVFEPLRDSRKGSDLGCRSRE